MSRFENPWTIVLIVQYKMFLCLSEYSVDSLGTCQTSGSDSKFVDTQTTQSDVLFEHFISIYTSFALTLLGRFSTRSWM